MVKKLVLRIWDKRNRNIRMRQVKTNYSWFDPDKISCLYLSSQEGERFLYKAM